MRYKVCFLTNRELQTGFLLGGGEVYAVENEERLKEDFKKLWEDKEVGLIAIQDEFYWEIKRQFAKEIKSGWPLVISFPSEKRTLEQKDFIAEMIKEAIGYYVKLR